MAIELRDYQKSLITAVKDSFNRVRRSLMQLPTGGGKTIIFGRIAQGMAQRQRPTLILAHRRELIDQASKKLSDFGAPHGIAQAGFSRTPHLIQVGSVQTVVNRIGMLPRFELIVVDEAHHATSPTYKKILESYPDAYVLGVTATPQRLDGRGLGEVFQDLVVGPSMQVLIDQGHLARFDYYAPPSKADLSAVHVQAGDFKRDELAEAMDKASIVGDAIEHYRKHLNGRPTLVFCVSVAHAHHVAEAYRAQGYRAAAVDGDMDRDDRRKRIAAIGTGELQIVTSCDLISEGLDVPNVIGAQLLRPTKSLTIFLQQCGRAFRPKEDGSRALVLDHAGNIERFGSPARNREWTLIGKPPREKSPGVTTCVECFAVFPIGKSPAQTKECIAASSSCPYLAERDDGFRKMPSQRDGELERVEDVEDRVWTTPDWTDGINIATARGPEWHQLMLLANSFERLDHIRKVRGFKPGWTAHALGRRRADQMLLSAAGSRRQD